MTTKARRRLDWWGLRATPVVFAAVMAIGAWADQIDLFGFWPGWINSGFFALAGVAMLGTVVHPDERGRAMAVLCDLLATLSRGMTILVVNQPQLPRKAEIIGGTVWLATAYMVVIVWMLTVPLLGEWEQRRRRNR